VVTLQSESHLVLYTQFLNRGCLNRPKLVLQIYGLRSSVSRQKTITQPRCHQLVTITFYPFFTSLNPSDFELSAVFFFAGYIDADIAITIARMLSEKRLLRSGSTSYTFRLTVTTIEVFDPSSDGHIPGTETFEKTSHTGFSSSPSSPRHCSSLGLTTSSWPMRTMRSSNCSTHSFLTFHVQMSCNVSRMFIPCFESMARSSSAFIGLFSSSSSFASTSSPSMAFSSRHGSKLRQAPCSAA